MNPHIEPVFNSVKSIVVSTIRRNINHSTTIDQFNFYRDQINNSKRFRAICNYEFKLLDEDMYNKTVLHTAMDCHNLQLSEYFLKEAPYSQKQLTALLEKAISNDDCYGVSLLLRYKAPVDLTCFSVEINCSNKISRNMLMLFICLNVDLEHELVNKNYRYQPSVLDSPMNRSIFAKEIREEFAQKISLLFLCREAISRFPINGDIKNIMLKHLGCQIRSIC